MTKRFWGCLMLFSLLLTVGAGAYLYMELQMKNTVDVPLRSTQTSPPPEAAPPQQESAPPVEETAAAPAPEPEPVIQERNIGFTFFSSKAKKIFIVGEFNDWKRQPLKRVKGNKWQTSLKIKPGTYKYLYVLDNRRVKDPNNSKVSDDGKSLIIVKPAPKS